eukprot:CAMPEP_0117657668 /NCGR_PEP_ID=MMETSP0804-20121206/5453_1 /TAXON_ID=1074897 /ORGANISM="Tetraselmis astigmatica, Strain CCMP880" /LENGTH=59 /DNA_ID=CAMNT_0005464137 /DNA_START=45 /DNA_END=224 /DNA_ORIENTATION=+
MNSINKFFAFFGAVGVCAYGLSSLEGVFQRMGERQADRAHLREMAARIAAERKKIAAEE